MSTTICSRRRTPTDRRASTAAPTRASSDRMTSKIGCCGRSFAPSPLSTSWTSTKRVAARSAATSSGPTRRPLIISTRRSPNSGANSTTRFVSAPPTSFANTRASARRARPRTPRDSRRRDTHDTRDFLSDVTRLAARRYDAARPAGKDFSDSETGAVTEEWAVVRLVPRTCPQCGREFSLCGRCDRRYRYCGVACSRAARRATLRRAGRTYQASREGRFAHADRARRHRERRRAKSSAQIVTHHDSAGHAPSAMVLPSTVATLRGGAHAQPRPHPPARSPDLIPRPLLPARSEPGEGVTGTDDPSEAWEETELRPATVGRHPIRHCRPPVYRLAPPPSARGQT